MYVLGVTYPVHIINRGSLYEILQVLCDVTYPVNLINRGSLYEILNILCDVTVLTQSISLTDSEADSSYELYMYSIVLLTQSISLTEVASMRSHHIGHTLTFNVAPGTMSLLRIVEFSSNSPVNIKNLFTGLKGGSNRIQHELMKRELTIL